MAKPLSEVRALEVPSHGFVPIGGVVLTERGAEVINIEHPEMGDPYRGLPAAGLHHRYRMTRIGDPRVQFGIVAARPITTPGLK